jgi:ABC-type nitrate/sulfonate/bicarbonate transport system substrate-binding protein
VALAAIAFTVTAYAQDGGRVRLAYSAFSISFLNIFVARDAGLFKKQGLESGSRVHV